MKKKLFTFIFLFAIMLAALIIYFTNKSPSTIAPFSNIVWGNTLENICESEGNTYENSLSISGGYNYIYPKQYLGFDGYIQYNIDDSNTLCGISWFCISNDQQTSNKIYDSIKKDTISHLGKENDLDTSNVYTGKKWETKDSNIMLISFSQNNEYAVQISYLLKEDD